MLQKTFRRPIPVGQVMIAIVALAALIRIALTIYFKTYLISAANDHYVFGWEAGRIARALASGNGFSSPLPAPTGPTAWLAPVYPLILAGIFKIFGAYTVAAAVAAYVFNIVVSALTCVVLYRLGKRIFSVDVGLGAAFLFAIYPPSIWYAINMIWDTTLLAFLIVLLVSQFYELPPVPSFGQVVRLGLLMGFVVLVNPAPALLYPLAIGWIWLRSRGARFPMLRAAVTALSCIAVFVPWMARNAVVVGEFAPRSSAGIEARLGNNEIVWRAGTRGATHLTSVFSPNESPDQTRLFDQLGESGYDRMCWEQTKVFIWNNPGKFLDLTLRRIWAWWLGDPLQDALNMHAGFSLFIWKRLAILLPLPFLIFGAAAALRNRRPVGPLLWILAVYPILYYFLVVEERFRFPIEPLEVLLCAYGIGVLRHSIFVNHLADLQSAAAYQAAPQKVGQDGILRSGRRPLLLACSRLRLLPWSKKF